MRIISRPLTQVPDEASLALIGPASDLLFIDIETTGLSREKNHVYLIGCAYYQPEGWHMIQWFDNTGIDEKQILSSFRIFASEYRCLVHYNGSRFDIPFLQKRLILNGLEPLPDQMRSMDLYGVVRPYKRLLGLPDYRQQTLETYLKTGRTEEQSGKDLIRTYKQYIANPCQELLEPVLQHNQADLEGLAGILPVMSYQYLSRSTVRVRKAQANYYRDPAGKQAEELLLHFSLDIHVPVPLYSSLDGCHIKIEGDRGLLKVPLYNEVMKYFYANYKDYYYLPEEDMAIHKYIAGYVDRDHRVQARAETCYTRKPGVFLPQWQDGEGRLFVTPFFRRGYREPDYFFEFTEEHKKDRQFLSEYAAYVFGHILEAG